MIANKIKEKLKCDILEIETVEPYSKDYDSVVNDEQNSEASNHLPEIKKINIDSKFFSLQSGLYSAVNSKLFIQAVDMAFNCGKFQI